MEKHKQMQESRMIIQQQYGDDTSTRSSSSSNTAFDKQLGMNQKMREQSRNSIALSKNSRLQRNHSSSLSVDSQPFLEHSITSEEGRPLLDTGTSSNAIEYERETPQQRLILKPSSSVRTSSNINSIHLKPSSNLEASSVVSDSSGHIYRNTTKAVVHKIFSAAQNRKRSLQHSQQIRQSTTQIDDYKNSAVTFARDSTKAGFLHKLGSNIHQYKRRFFVLKPSTYLYYFLSPNDIEPRGCIDLESTSINKVQKLPDGRYRFEVQTLSIHSSDDHSSTNQKNQSIILEARNEEIGQEWIKCLTEERLPFCKQKISAQESQIQSLHLKVDELQTKIEDFRLVENDRDGAIQDANEWKSKFNNLNEAVTLLTRQIKMRREDKPKDDKNDQNNFASLSDEQRQLDVLETRGSNFPPLYNACQMLLQNIQLITTEADAIAKDLQDSSSSAKTVGKKLSKAEKLVCKLWEENCAMRDTIKQAKKEKKVLVTEVKSLIKTVEQKESAIQELHVKGCNSEETRLIHELEEHLATTVRLHQQFCAANTSVNIKSNKVTNLTLEKVEPTQMENMKALHPPKEPSNEQMTKIKNKDQQEKNDSNTSNTSNDSNQGTTSDSSTDRNTSILDTTLSPLRPTRLLLPSQSKNYDDSSASDVSSVHIPSYGGLVSKKSLYEDDSSNCEEDYSSESEEPINQNDIANIASNIDEETSTSTVQLSYQNQTNQSPTTLRENEKKMTNHLTNASNYEEIPKLKPDEETQSISSTSMDRINHLDQLNVDDDYASSEQSVSRSVITDNAQATSKLVCALNDVGDLEISDMNTNKRYDDEVYHLTFYGRKIGLQFQKVPIEANSGILNDAMTTDVHVDSRFGRTAAELRMISSISENTSKAFNKDKRATDEFCKVATPIDAVLVCGFHGFDDNNSSQRPKLGSRLVAFDGVSVEVGRWTFESVKRAIQARGRPLTLSFRNDYLTTKQRGILTKAVNEVEISRSRYPPKLLSGISSYNSNKKKSFHGIHRNDSSMFDQPISNFSPNRRNGRVEGNTNNIISTPNSVQSHHSYRSGISSFSSPAFGGKSLSDAGASGILSSTLGPLVANLMTGLEKPEKKSQYGPPPQYLQGASSSLDNLPNHHDFKAGLL